MFPSTENKEQNWSWVIVLGKLILKINHECTVNLPVVLTSVSFSRYAWVQECAYSPHEKNLVNYPNSHTNYLEKKSSQEILPVIVLVQKQSEMTHSQNYYFIK